MKSFLLVLFALLFGRPCFSFVQFQHCASMEPNGQCHWVPMAAEARMPIETVLGQLSQRYRSLTQRIVKVQLVDEFPGSASVGPSDVTKVKIDGYTLILSKRALEFRRDISGFLTWKESQFLKSARPVRLPKITANIPSTEYPGLYYVILHELGHVAWYEHGPDKIVCSHPMMESRPYWEAAFFVEAYLAKHPGETYRSLSCEATKESFQAQSWNSKWQFDQQNRYIDSRLSAFDVRELSKICFYGCKEQTSWTDEEVGRLYRNLYLKKPFTSVYSAYFKPGEDFAESFALYALAQQPNASYRISLASGESFDLLAKLQSPIFQSKRRILDDLFRRIDAAPAVNARPLP